MRLGPSHFVRFSRDGAWLASCGERSVHVRRADVARPRVSAPLRHGAGADFAPDGRVLLVRTTSGALHALGPLHSGPSLTPFSEEGGEGAAPRWSACGRYVVDGRWSGRLAVVDARDRSTVARREFPGDLIVEIMPTSDGATWFVHHSPRATADTAPPDPDRFSVWSLPLPERPHRVLCPGLRFVRHSALSGRGDLLAVVHGAPPATLSIVDTAGGATLCSTAVDVGGAGGRLAWSPDGRLAVALRHGVRLYTAELALLGELPLELACDVAFSPRGDALAIGSWASGRVVPVTALLG